MIDRQMTQKETGGGTGEVTLYTDGASRGNPGDAAWAYVIVRDGAVAASS